MSKAPWLIDFEGFEINQVLHVKASVKEINLENNVWCTLDMHTRTSITWPELVVRESALTVKVLQMWSV